MKKQVEELEDELETQKRQTREQADAREDAQIKLKKLETSNDAAKKEIERYRFEHQEH